MRSPKLVDKNTMSSPDIRDFRFLQVEVAGILAGGPFWLISLSDINSDVTIHTDSRLLVLLLNVKKFN